MRVWLGKNFGGAQAVCGDFGRAAAAISVRNENGGRVSPAPATMTCWTS